MFKTASLTLSYLDILAVVSYTGLDPEIFGVQYEELKLNEPVTFIIHYFNNCCFL